ncbi:MAG: hypothetical protein KTR35_13025 [Gammaproteobacteria bacterium]|nr:hypothetical protein [Gammaproteobacteria bacterium]
MSKITVPSVTSDGNNPSYFSEKVIELEGTPERMLSAQQQAENFRLRTSEPGYFSDWHTAGDPTLLVVLSGVVEIELRDSSKKVFSKGHMFVAEDYMDEETVTDEQHGHRARVLGFEPLHVLHLKLSVRT